MRDEAHLRREVFEVEGLCCAAEVRQIEAELEPLPGVDRLSFDVVRSRLAVEGSVSPDAVEQAVSSLGMRASRLTEGPDEPAEVSWWSRHGRLVLTIVAGVFWALSLLFGYAYGQDVLAGLFSVGAVAAGGRYVFPRGWHAALNRTPDMNFLMSVAAIGALAIGEWEEAASVIFLFAVAQLLERYSMDRARDSIRALMDLSPAEATVLRDSREVRIPADQVRVGEVVVVRPGEKIPVDGEVLEGRSSVDQAPITGESLPIAKEPGSEVFAGTLNGEGALEVRSIRAPEDTTLARIIHAVEDAQATRAPSQTFVDRFARVYTPLVVGSAVALMLLPPLAGFGTWGEWFYRGLVLLVVACPCALVISTPVTIVSAIAGAARRGILVKGGLHLENTGRARVVALDKTGTLTRGEAQVVDVEVFDGRRPEQLLRLAAAVERRSEHPLGRAILRHARAQGLENGTPSASETEALPGLGVRARVDGSEIFVGSERLFRELGALGETTPDRLASHEAEGRTAVLVGRRSPDDATPRVLGLISLADRLRPEAAEALANLRRAGLRRLVMLTGDNSATARAVGETLAAAGGRVDEFRAELLPGDKVDAVRKLRARDAPVLMIGDGVNDAPALAAADVGIAMGTAGTDVALETADIALMADDLSSLPVTVRLARKAERIIRTNIGFALAVKAVFVVLAVSGIATLWMAVLADMGASLVVIGNGMRVLRG